MAEMERCWGEKRKRERKRIVGVDFLLLAVFCRRYDPVRAEKDRSSVLMSSHTNKNHLF